MDALDPARSAAISALDALDASPAQQAIDVTDDIIMRLDRAARVLRQLGHEDLATEVAQASANIEASSARLGS